MRLNFILSLASGQSKLVRCHGLGVYLTPNTHFSLNSYISTESNSLQEDDESIITQVVQHLQNHEDNWKLEQLNYLLFSDSTSSPRRLFQITRRLPSSSKALQFFDHVKANTPTEQYQSLSYAFQGILELASREPNSECKLLKLYRMSKEKEILLTINATTLLIRRFGRAGMVDESLLVFNELDPSLKNTHVYNTLIGMLLQLGRMDYVLHLLGEMLKPDVKFPPNDHTRNILFGSLSKREQFKRTVSEEEILDLVTKFSEHGVFPDTISLTQLITKLCRNNKTDHAWDLLLNVINLGGPVEAASCNALLTGLGKSGDFSRMNVLMAKMKEMDIIPNVVTFGILINHLCKNRRLDEAFQVLEKMRGEDNNGVSVEPDVICYNTMIDGLCKVGRTEEGLCLMDRMRMQNGCAPNIVTYNCLIDGFCNASNIDKAEELFAQMNREGIWPNVITLNTLIKGLCRHGRISIAVKFFNEMQEKGLKGNAVTYTALITAFCSVNNIDKAKHYFNEMLRSKCLADSVVYYSLISGLSHAGRMDEASFVVSKLKEAGFCLDTVCYNVLISGFCKKKKLDKVHEMLKDMEDTGIKPDVVTYNSLISYLSKAGDFATAHRLMKKMTNDGHVPTVVTYGALIHAYCLHGNVDEGIEIFRKMSSASKVPPNTVIYNILVDSLCKRKDTEHALSLMDDMKVKGIRPNTTTYNALFKGLRDEKMLEKAFEFMDRMIEDACNPDYVTMEILTEWLPVVGEAEKLKKFVQGYEVSTSMV